jgi:CheY-like chemotaxis protein
MIAAQGGGRVTDDIYSLRILVVSGSRAEQDLLRRAASAPTVPIEIVEADGAAAAGPSIAAGVDLAFFDMELGGETVAQLAAAARAAAKPPFTVLLGSPARSTPFQTDALADKPVDLEEAKHLMNGVTRVGLPSRVLIVDDSATMRSIVRKILTATRFPFAVTEVGQGGQALELARQAEFDIVFVDYNMPGFSGLETISEFRRTHRRLNFVLITSTPDEAVAERARSLGAAFLKKPFFPADMEAVLCGFYGLRALNPISDRAGSPG